MDYLEKVEGRRLILRYKLTDYVISGYEISKGFSKDDEKNLQILLDDFKPNTISVFPLMVSHQSLRASDFVVSIIEDKREHSDSNTSTTSSFGGVNVLSSTSNSSSSSSSVIEKLQNSKQGIIFSLSQRHSEEFIKFYRGHLFNFFIKSYQNTSEQGKSLFQMKRTVCFFVIY